MRRDDISFNLSCCYPYEVDYKSAPVELKGRAKRKRATPTVKLKFATTAKTH